MLEAVNYANISVMALAAVFVLIAVRQVGKNSLAIWQIMLLGALTVLFTGQISPEDAARAINLDVMIFLGAMFVIGECMQESGYLLYLFNRFFGLARNLDQLLLLILFAMGFLSALLMNDTIAIIGTPLMLYFARTLKIAPKLLLLTLAFAVTIGSAMSPIGNPQNLLIAVNANLSNPFLVFLQYLLLPTIANLLLAYLLLRLFYKEQFQNRSLQIGQEEISDPALARLSRISFVLLIALILAKMGAVIFGVGGEFRLTYIALISALPILLFSSKRYKVLRNIDWCTLIFFASMFVLMDAVWRSGIFQSLLAGSNADLASIPTILALSGPLKPAHLQCASGGPLPDAADQSLPAGAHGPGRGKHHRRKSLYFGSGEQRDNHSKCGEERRDAHFPGVCQGRSTSDGAERAGLLAVSMISFFLSPLSAR